MRTSPNYFPLLFSFVRSSSLAFFDITFTADPRLGGGSRAPRNRQDTFGKATTRISPSGIVTRDYAACASLLVARMNACAC
jgi:hypothetical protein